jgi:hypothetical protein
MTRRFERALWLMRRHDPQAAEDGYHLLLPHASEHVEELIAAFAAETTDHGLRCWLLELIAEARSPLALSVLVQQLNGDDEALRSLAVRGLTQLDSKPAREALWRARSNGQVQD